MFEAKRADTSDCGPGTYRKFMLVPSSACRASCLYCFGPNTGPVMPLSTLEAAVDFIGGLSEMQDTVDITFHGGEPLLAGEEWYRAALPKLAGVFGERLRLNLQSNLWEMTDSFARLFESYGVGIGTSLDGPEEINDRQRGAGCFSRTMAGIRAVRKLGMDVGVICTFTSLSVPRYREVCEFFARQGLTFSVHAAVNGPAGAAAPILGPEAYERLFLDLFRYYVDNIARMRIPTFDLTAKGLADGRGGLCVFSDCLGEYFAVSPTGGVFTCNRFVHDPRRQVGDVFSNASTERLRSSNAWLELEKLRGEMVTACGDCQHLACCRGGCPYNAISAGLSRDPLCAGYRGVFNEIAEEALKEVFSEPNMTEVCKHGQSRHGILRKGPLLRIMRGGTHPREEAAKARETLAAAALGCGGGPEDAVARLDRAGLVTDSGVALSSVAGLVRKLQRQVSGLANFYLAVTTACNLSCSHCYAQTDPPRREERHMPAGEVSKALREAAAAGFSKLLITGGEPFCHPQFKEVLSTLSRSGSNFTGIRRVLRTNLSLPIPEDVRRLLPDAVDEVVVSVDGGPSYHDARRGRGAYARTLENLRRLKRELPKLKLSIAAVLPSTLMEGAEGRAVRELGRDLDVPARFRPLLPLGRAAGSDIPMSFHPMFAESDDEAPPFHVPPSITCGLGLNLSVTPEGDAYPCHALSGAAHYLGNILSEGVEALVGSSRFNALRASTVDRNLLCSRCALRYLCGGFCRAWRSYDHPDAPPLDCRPLHDRANRALKAALDVLGVDADRWTRAGLPLPDHPPILRKETRNNDAVRTPEYC